MDSNYDNIVEIPTPNEYDGGERHERPIWKDAALEFCGTFIFVYISLAGVNQAVLSGEPIDQLHIAICFALGLTTGIVVAGQSGGHLNPAVSVTMYFTEEGFCLKRLFSYITAQMLGGFIAGLLVISVYYSWINDLENPKSSIGSFGTLKSIHNSLFSSILDQFVGSSLLMFGIMTAPPSVFKPAIIGLVLGGLGLFQGGNGFAFNMARDTAARFASCIVFGVDPFTAMDYWFWVPIVVPFFGIPFGYFVSNALKLIE